MSCSPSFFFYLRPHTAHYSTPSYVSRPEQSIYTLTDWQVGRPLQENTLLIESANPFDDPDMAKSWLDSHCQLWTSEHLVNDSGYKLKARWFRSFGQRPWRIEIFDYHCHPNYASM